MGIEERFEQLRRSAACTHLSRDQVNEPRRHRVRRWSRSAGGSGNVLAELPEHVGEVRKLLNVLARTVR